MRWDGLLLEFRFQYLDDFLCLFQLQVGTGGDLFVLSLVNGILTVTLKKASAATPRQPQIWPHSSLMGLPVKARWNGSPFTLRAMGKL